MKMYQEDEIESYIEYSPAKPFIERFLRLGYDKETAIQEGLKLQIQELYIEIETAQKQLQYFESN